MASNEQVLNAISKMNERIADLRVQVSAVPEIKAQTDELVRAIKGHNGSEGLLTRVAIYEKQLTGHLDEAHCMREDLSEGIAEIRSMLNEHLDDTANERIKKLESGTHAKLDEEREIRKENREDCREEKRERRRVRYELLVAIVLALVNLAVGILSRIQINTLLDHVP